jgi:hypothetical protein
MARPIVTATAAHFGPLVGHSAQRPEQRRAQDQSESDAQPRVRKALARLTGLVPRREEAHSHRGAPVTASSIAITDWKY